MSGRLQTLKSRISFKSDAEDDSFSYFWDDIEHESSVAVTSVEVFQSTLSENKTEIVLILTLFCALASVFVNVNGDLIQLILSAVICVLISFAFVVLNSEYREPKKKMDNAIEKMTRMDFTANPEFIYMDELPNELKKIEQIRTNMASQQMKLQDAVNQIVTTSTTTQQNLNFLVKDFNKVTQNLEKTIVGSSNLQETRLFASNVSSEIDHFTRVFDNALAINEDVTLAIKTIGKQINMLALNAGIEAARAGEYGIGFEVVSSNLQRLSQNTVRTNNEMKASRSTINQEATSTLSSISGSMNSLIDTIDKSNQIYSGLGSQIFDLRQRLNELSADIVKVMNEVQNLTNVIDLNL